MFDLHEPETWVAIAFVIFVGLMIYSSLVLALYFIMVHTTLDGLELSVLLLL